MVICSTWRRRLGSNRDQLCMAPFRFGVCHSPLRKRGKVKRKGKIHFCQVLGVGCFLLFMVPFACALFPQNVNSQLVDTSLTQSIINDASIFCCLWRYNDSHPPQVEITSEYLRQKDPEAYSQLQEKSVTKNIIPSLFLQINNWHLRYKDRIPTRLVYNKGL